MQILKPYILENDFLYLEVISLGARIIAWKHKSDGINIVTSFDHKEDYLQDNIFYLGATIGPTCGRISNGEVPILHGGEAGFEKLIFKGEVSDHKLVLQGNVDSGNLKITMSLEKETLSIHYHLVMDSPSLVSLTNHSYFNLSGTQNMSDHTLQIGAESIYNMDSKLCVQDHLIHVENTPFDYRKPRRMDDILSMSHPLLDLTRNLDHLFKMDQQGYLLLETKMKSLKVQSSMPCIQCYYANYFEDSEFTGFKNHQSLAIEPQYASNLITHQSQVFDETIYYELKMKR